MSRYPNLNACLVHTWNLRAYIIREVPVFEPKPTVLVQMTGELAISKRVTFCGTSSGQSKKNEVTFV